MMPSSPGHITGHTLTNGHTSPLGLNVTTADDLSAPSEDESSDTKENAARVSSSDEDAPGEEYDEDEEMADATDSSEDADAEGEPDADYDSETPPPARADSRARSSSSQESTRPSKRKASVEDDEHITQNPELYGLRRSVCGLSSA
jgi:chromodomain-helicase-DNA-binding protein 1